MLLPTRDLVVKAIKSGAAPILELTITPALLSQSQEQAHPPHTPS